MNNILNSLKRKNNEEDNLRPTKKSKANSQKIDVICISDEEEEVQNAKPNGKVDNMHIVPPIPIKIQPNIPSAECKVTQQPNAKVIQKKSQKQWVLYHWNQGQQLEHDLCMIIQKLDIYTKILAMLSDIFTQECKVEKLYKNHQLKSKTFSALANLQSSLRAWGFDLTTNSSYVRAPTNATQQEVDYWQNSVKRLITVTQVTWADRHAKFSGTEYAEGIKLKHEMINKIYAPIVKSCGDPANPFNIPNFIAQKVICEGFVDYTHKVVLIGSCVPREEIKDNRLVEYAVVSGYFNSSPMLILNSRLSYRYWRVERIGRGLVLIFWHNGEATLEKNTDNSYDDYLVDVPQNSEQVQEVPQKKQEHVFAHQCKRMLLADDFQIGSMLLQHWNKFKTHTYRYLLDPQVIALAMIPKPFRMSKLEQQIFQTYFQDCAPLFDPLVGYEPKEHLVSILALLFGQDPSVLHNQFVDSGIILRRAIAPLDLNHDPLESLLDPDDSQDTERIAKELEQAIAREESELERLKEKLQLEYKNLALQQPWEQNDEKLHDLENEEYTSRIWEQRNKQYAEVRKMITKFMNEVDTEEGDESLSLIEVEDDNANVVEEYFFKIDDITQGRGEVAIPAINMADHNAFPDLTYIESFQKVPYGENAECIKNLILCTGCECRSSCDSGKCSCCGLQAQSHSFYAKDGRLKEPLQLGTIIFECNALCACADFKSKCVNRVVQNGSQLPLQVFKTKQKGWGVRTLVDIKAKQFVDEYLGEIISETEAETRGEMYDKRGCSYLFDLGSVDENNFTIDADKFANVTRFFNHSCDPNMGSARVCIDVQDINTARIAFFALRDVPAGEELTFDYKYQIQKRIRCYCGASNCKKWVQ